MNREVSSEKLKKATLALTHRGPDGWNSWMDSERKIGLGHARLSIIDLESGTQPLHNEDNTIHAVVNGELYDFERIRAALVKSGHSFSTGSDSEVLIHLYEDLGEECLHELRGEFAFVLWDEKKRKMFAARDRFGIKPLYYTVQNGNVYLASEVKALLAAGISAHWDEESLYSSTFFGGIPIGDRTFFKDIYQLSPGFTMTAENGDVRFHKYWDFHYPLMEDADHFGIREEDAVEQFRELFEEAIRLRLRADVPVGVYLSGGIDSCSILGTVAKIRGEGTKAFTIGFEDEIYDESAIAEETAEFTGTEFNFFTITAQQMASNFPNCVYHSEALLANPHSVAKYILSRHVRDAGYKVVMTGEGTDEILGGYAHFRQDLLLHDPDYWNWNAKNAIDDLKQNNIASSGLLLQHQSKRGCSNTLSRELGFVPSWMLPMIDAAKRGNKFKEKEARKRFGHIDPYKQFLEGLDIEREVKRRHVLNQSMYLWSKQMLPKYLLSNLGDRMEMAHSVEGRVPFLDHKLVEFVTRLPASLKIRGLQEKYILREALRPVLSDTVYRRQKHPFMAPPMAGNKKDPLFSFLTEYISDNIDAVPGIDGRKVKLLLKLLPFMPEKTRRMVDPTLVVLGSMAGMRDQFGMSVMS